MKISGTEIWYGFAYCRFGNCFIAGFENKICQLSFFDTVEYETNVFFDNFAGNNLVRNDEKAAKITELIFEQNMEVPLHLEGTEFQLSVWKALRDIPVSSTTTYADIAEKIGKPKAVRAVGTAVGANPIAYIIPCHRVIRTDGGLGGYRWGLEIKKKMLDFESLQS